MKILALKPYNPPVYEKELQDLIDRANKISNISDQALIFTIFARECNPKQRKQRQLLLETAFSKTALIPSAYDRYAHFEYLLEHAKKIDGSLFESKIKEAFSGLAGHGDDEFYSTHKNLIDLAYQHSPELATKLIDFLDTDPARKQFYKPIQMQYKKLEVEKTVSDDIGKILKVKDQELISEIAVDQLSELNSLKRTPKSIEQLLNVLEAGSRMQISRSFPLFSLFVENCNRKYHDCPKNRILLSNINKGCSEAVVVVNSIALHSSSLSKNRKFLNVNSNPAINVIKKGERDKAITLLKDWLEENLKDEIYVIDPYFSEEDLMLLKLFKEINPGCSVNILTSKEGNKNRNLNNKEIYWQQWESISAESPPETVINIVSLPGFKSPFHDRWWISEDASSGLRIGTSFNSLGLSKDSEISYMAADESNAIYNSEITNFLVNRIKRYQDSKVTYEIFELSNN